MIRRYQPGDRVRVLADRYWIGRSWAAGQVGVVRNHRPGDDVAVDGIEGSDALGDGFDVFHPDDIEPESASIERLSGLSYDRLSASEQLLALQVTCAAEDLVNRAGVMKYQGAEAAAFAERLKQMAAQLSHEALVALGKNERKAA